MGGEVAAAKKRACHSDPEGQRSLLKILFFTTHILRRLHKNRLRMWGGGIFVIKSIIFYFYDVHSKAVIKNRLRMWHGGIYVIIEKLNNDRSLKKPPSYLFLC